MADKPAYDPASGKPVYSPGGGDKPALGCLAFEECEHCDFGTPDQITVVISGVGNCPCMNWKTLSGTKFSWGNINITGVNGTHICDQYLPDGACDYRTGTSPVSISMDRFAGHNCVGSPVQSYSGTSVVRVRRNAPTDRWSVIAGEFGDIVPGWNVYAFISAVNVGIGVCCSGFVLTNWACLTFQPAVEVRAGNGGTATCTPSGGSCP